MNLESWLASWFATAGSDLRDGRPTVCLGGGGGEKIDSRKWNLSQLFSTFQAKCAPFSAASAPIFAGNGFSIMSFHLRTHFSRSGSISTFAAFQFFNASFRIVLQPARFHECCESSTTAVAKNAKNKICLKMFF